MRIRMTGGEEEEEKRKRTEQNTKQESYRAEFCGSAQPL
jgi:hypothetical protein